MNNILEKFEKDVFKNIDKENFKNIISFLLKEKCDYIEDIISDYFDLLTMEYKEFIEKYNILNKKYNGLFLEKASENMNLLEEFYNL